MLPELDSRRTPGRIKGKPAIVRSLRGLLLRVHRFGRHRARTRADVLWAARMIDELTTTLKTAENRKR